MGSRTRSGTSAREILAANLRRLRKEIDLSQEALADKAELHRTFVGSVERAERNISLDNVERLAKALGVTMSQLLAESPRKGRDA